MAKLVKGSTVRLPVLLSPWSTVEVATGYRPVHRPSVAVQS